MKNIVMELREYGCDMDGAMERFLGDTVLFEKCLDSVLGDETFDDLGKALKEGEVRKAFEFAHTLKGVTGNMGLTPLYNTITSIVEPLRICNTEGLQDKYEKLMDELKKIREMVYKGDK